jgi:hypothetical protein
MAHESQSIGQEDLPQLQDRPAERHRPGDLHQPEA